MSKREEFTFSVNFEVLEGCAYTGQEIREKCILPALAAIRKKIEPIGHKRFIEPEKLLCCEHVEILRDMCGIPIARLIIAFGYLNVGTEDEPNLQFVKMGRVDVQLTGIPGGNRQ